MPQACATTQPPSRRSYKLEALQYLHSGLQRLHKLLTLLSSADTTNHVTTRRCQMKGRFCPTRPTTFASNP